MLSNARICKHQQHKFNITKLGQNIIDHVGILTVHYILRYNNK